MDKAKLLSLLHSPQALAELNVQELEEVVERYPYFQTAHLLLAKKYQVLKSDLYEKKLNLAATYAVDRSALYHLIETPVEPAPAEATTLQNTNIPEPELEEVAETTNEEKKEEATEQESKEREEAATEAKETEETTIEEPAPKEAKILPLHEVLEQEQELQDELAEKEQQKLSAADELLQTLREKQENSEAISKKVEESAVETTEEEKEIEQVEELKSESEVEDKSEVISDLEIKEAEKQEHELDQSGEEENETEESTPAISKKVEDTEEATAEFPEPPVSSDEDLLEYSKDLPEPEEEPLLHTPEDFEELNAATDEEVEEILQQQEKIISIESKHDDAVTEEAPEKIQPGEKHSFTDWLKLMQGKTEAKPADENKKEPEVKSEIKATENEKEEQLIDPVASIEAEYILSGKEEPDDDYDSLRKRPAPAQATEQEDEEEEPPVEEMAKKSLEQDWDMVTETLADILVNQGKYERALKIYEQLRLKYPKKSSYFATKIEEIQKRQ